MHIFRKNATAYTKRCACVCVGGCLLRTHQVQGWSGLMQCNERRRRERGRAGGGMRLGGLHWQQKQTCNCIHTKIKKHTHTHTHTHGVTHTGTRTHALNAFLTKLHSTSSAAQTHTNTQTHIRTHTHTGTHVQIKPWCGTLCTCCLPPATTRHAPRQRPP